MCWRLLESTKPAASSLSGACVQALHASRAGRSRRHRQNRIRVRNTVSHLAADPRSAARGAEPGAANASAAASARAFEEGNEFLVDLVRQVSAASQAATAHAWSADVANDSGAEAQDGKPLGILAGPHTPVAQRTRAANATRPLAALSVWNASANNTTTEECVPGTILAQRWLLARCAGGTHGVQAWQTCKGGDGLAQ